MTIRTELNPYLETLGLLYLSAHPEKASRSFLVSEANELGIDGDALYRKFGPVHKRYVSAFQKQWNREEISAMDGFDFFFDTDDWIPSLLFVCGEHPHWFAPNGSPLQEKEIILAFVNQILTDRTVTKVPSLSELLSLLEQSGLSTSLCWKMTLLLQSPLSRIRQLIAIVQASLSAYQHASETIALPLGKLLAAFPHTKYTTSALEDTAVLTPVLVFPAMEAIVTDTSRTYGYVGLFVKDVYRMLEQARRTQQNLLPALKAISDSSKFAILRSLQISPKYNLELASECNLSAATISHHMNALLACDLVHVEKREGKVYYTLQRETLQRMIDALQSVFSL